MLTMEEARARVMCGAAYLDTQIAGWAARIDIATFQIDSCVSCAISQVYADEDFIDGLIAAGLTDGNGVDYLDSDGTPLYIAYGFAAGGPGWGDDLGPNGSWQLLQDAWLDAIAERTVPASFPIQQPESVTAG